MCVPDLGELSISTIVTDWWRITVLDYSQGPFAETAGIDELKRITRNESAPLSAHCVLRAPRIG